MGFWSEFDNQLVVCAGIPHHIARARQRDGVFADVPRNDRVPGNRALLVGRAGAVLAGKHADANFFEIVGGPGRVEICEFESDAVHVGYGLIHL